MPSSKADLSAKLKETTELIKALNEKKKLLTDRKGQPLDVEIWNALYSSKSKVGKYIMGFGDAEGKGEMQSWALGTVREINNYLNTVHKKEARPENSKALKDAMRQVEMVLVSLRKSLVAFARAVLASEESGDLKLADQERRILRNVTVLASGSLVVQEYEKLDEFLTAIRDQAGKLKARAEEASLEKKQWLTIRRDMVEKIEDIEDGIGTGTKSNTELEKATTEKMRLKTGVEKGDDGVKGTDRALARIRRDQKALAETYKTRMDEFDKRMMALRREATTLRARPAPEAKKLLDNAKRDPKKVDEDQKKANREVQNQLEDLPKRCTVLYTTINQSMEAISKFLSEAEKV